MSRGVPEQPTRLIGRDHEVATLRGLLLAARPRLLTLTGPAGVGKTHLAIEVARGLQPDLAGDVFFVDLAPVRDTDLVALVIARAAGIRESLIPPITELSARIGGRPVLLLLDNFEQVLGAAPFIAALLAACPALRVLATSRAPLRLRWEQTVPVPPLALPAANRHAAPSSQLSKYSAHRRGGIQRGVGLGAATFSAAELRDFASVQLFVERARAALPTFVLDETNAAAVAAICTGLDGLPLAIELAAVRVRSETPASIAQRLERRLDLLARGPVDLPVRQQTLRGAIGWSHDLLTPAERAIFRRLGVFLGGFTVAEAATVAGPESTNASEAESKHTTLDLLGELVEKNLIRCEEHTGDTPRFTMLETVREYALEQLLSSGELESARRAHADAFLALLERAESLLGGPEQRAWLERLERERGNVQAALRWATAADGGEETALRLAASASRFWEMHGDMTEGRAWLERALAAGAGAPAIHRVKALNAAGNLARAQGDLETATDRYQASLELLRTLGDERRMAVLLNNLGVIAQDQGAYERAEALYEESLAHKQSLGDIRGAAMSLNNLGMTAHYRGRHVAAATRFTEGLALFRDAADEWGIAMALSNLGMAALAHGDVPAAASRYMESLTLRRRLGDQPGIAWCLEGIAAIACVRRGAERAAMLLGTAARLREEIGARPDPAARTAIERTREAAQGSLSEEAFRSAWDAGRRLMLEAAIDEALAPAIDAPWPATRKPAYRPDGLSEREMDVLRLLAAGQTSKEIAAALVLSVRTVEHHRASIATKTGVRTRAEIVAYAAHHGVALVTE